VKAEYSTAATSTTASPPLRSTPPTDPPSTAIAATTPELSSPWIADPIPPSTTPPPPPPAAAAAPVPKPGRCAMGQGLTLAHFKAQLEDLRDTSLTSELNLSTLGPHPRVNMGCVVDKVSLS